MRPRLPGEGAVPLREMVVEFPDALPLSLECVPPADTPWDSDEWTTSVLASARRALA